MIIPEIKPEIVSTVEMLMGSMIAFAMGLNAKQRKAIRERDGNTCQATAKKATRTSCSGNLEVDHVLPKEFGEIVFDLTEEQYNNPNNLLTKCKLHHRDAPFSHHPDVNEAVWDYRDGNKEAIADAIEEHKTKAKKGEIYWNPTYDAADALKASLLTERQDKKKGGRKKWWPF